MIVSKWCIKLFIGWNSCHQLLLKIIEGIDIIYFNESFRDLRTYFHQRTVGSTVWSGVNDIVRGPVSWIDQNAYAHRPSPKHDQANVKLINWSTDGWTDCRLEHPISPWIHNWLVIVTTWRETDNLPGVWYIVSHGQILNRVPRTVQTVRLTGLACNKNWQSGIPRP